ncbi:MarR family winged helix-turn-helix transcriptional regulator [Rugamonas apoptosis]|uniref:Winged helix DNA-binding protein n=1 Tax=Rugamonas apoptosis TaxID=2758570 RepID=A0A7W2FEY3_9BURK|nr:MarR family transcriptional regulator [Rugamonas apoptosis]MBA5690487.1 winged helix DNA-binding protein [Rugamonas apoptosis]
MSSIEDRFSAALHTSARGWRLAVDRRLKHLGISQASWMAIAIVAKAATPLPQTRLAALVGVEDPTMVATIDRLVKAGYALRAPSPTDRRVKLVSLTEAGQDIYRNLKAESDVLRADLLRNIDPQALKLATEVLETLQAGIEAQL